MMRAPRATYRLQFRNGMTFDRAVELLPYLRELGISHIYASPLFAATAGSTHGYDVVDCNRFDSTLGGEVGFQRLSAALKQEGLGLILDFVPNHMAASSENPWWHDLLRLGRSSAFAKHFDIDWSAPRLGLPVLGASFEACLQAGDFALAKDPDTGGLLLRYYEQVFPLSPESEAEPRARLEAGETPAALSADRALLRKLHAAQAWELLDWRAARDKLTYRRFFEISGLVGLRVEAAPVFDDVHRRLLNLVQAGQVQGIRIDHIDGLADPKEYLRRLRAAVGPDLYIVVEKILEGEEGLKADWPVDGTTGYEFISALSLLQTSDREAEALTRSYEAFRGEAADYRAMAAEAKAQIVGYNLASELADLVRRAAALLGITAWADLEGAIIALISAFDRYRSYVETEGADPEDRSVVEAAAQRAKSSGGAPVHGLIDALADLLLLRGPLAQRSGALAFARRFQQISGPVMAKAVEDTLFYRYNRLIGLNEVGGDPEHLGDEAGAGFHAAMKRRAASRPGFSTTATHDTKRGEDARARHYSLSEAPAVWAAAAARWSRLNAALKRNLAEGTAPEAETEWLIYQALLGVWPPDLTPEDEVGLAALKARFLPYLEKALREAKLRSSWLSPNPPYESAVADFAGQLLSPRSQIFLQDFHESCRPFRRAGALNGLVQSLIKLTAPGVPDIYQGCELPDFSLVDPDNRRPVDFERRAHLLAGLGARALPAAIAERDWDRAKFAVLRVGLRARAQAPCLFAEGSYEPLQVAGDLAHHAVAFGRIKDTRAALVVVPRLTMALLEPGQPLAVPGGRWRDTAVEIPESLRGLAMIEGFSARRLTLPAKLPLAELLADTPLALLLPQDA